MSFLQRCGVSEHVTALVRAAHSDSLITTEGSRSIARARKGTLPGHNFADVLYNFAMIEVLGEVQARLREAGLVQTVPWTQGAPSFIAGGAETVDLEVAGIVYVDNINMVGEHANPVECVGSTQDNSSRVCLGVQEVWLLLNWGPNKTEAVLSLRCMLASQAASLLSKSGGATVLSLDPQVTADLRVVRAYKHLGLMATKTGSMPWQRTCP